MVWETGVQSQVESYQRLKWYLISPCLALSTIRLGSRVKWSNPGNGVVPTPTPWCCSYWKGSLRVTLDYGRQLFTYILGSIILSTKNDINIHIRKAWTSIDRLSIIWKSDFSNKIKEEFLQAEVEPLKDATCYFQIILEAVTYKIASVQPLTSHLTNHPSKTNKISWTILDKQW